MRFRRFVRSLLDFVSGTGPLLARRARPRTRQLRIEQLEPRSLLSVNVTGVSLFADTGIDGDQITSDPRLGISTSGMSDYGSAVISLDFDLDGNGQYGDPADQQGSLSFSDGTNSYVYDPADDPGVSLPDGPIKVRVRVDEFSYGGSGGTAQEFDFVLDTTAPVANVALKNDTGLSPSDGLTKDATLAGTGTAGDTVDVDFDGDGTSDGTAAIDSNGDWSLAPSGLADGQYTATVTVKDVAGNPDATASVSFILDTTAPVVTAFTPEQDAILAASPNTATVTFSEAVDLGLLPLDQSVNVTAASGENVAQTVALGDSDDIVITFNQQLAAGQYTTTALVAQTPDDRGTAGVRDLAGNALDDTQSGHPANASWTVDTASGLPTVSIEATDDTATEGDNQDNAEFTITVEGDFTGQLTVQFRVSADSTAEFQQIDHQKPDFKLTGVDFNRQNNLGTVTFFAGSTRSATITLKANRDNLDEGTEEAILELIEGSDYEIATDAATALAFLQDDSDAPDKLMVEFLVPENGNDKKLVSTEKLTIGNWPRAFTNVFRERASVRDDFTDRDPEHFFIQVSDPTKLGSDSVTIKLSTDSEGEDYDDNATTITLIKVAPGVFRSASLLLVSDDVDDDVVIGNVQDDTPGDRTHKVALGGKVSVSYEGLAAPAVATVPIEKIIEAHVIVLKSPDGTILIGEPFVDKERAQDFGERNGVFDNDEEFRDIDGDGKYTEFLTTEQHARDRIALDFKVANERWAQIGVKFTYSIEFKTAPGAIADGEIAVSPVPRNKDNRLNPDELTLFQAGFNSNDRTDVEIYYVSRLLISKRRPEDVRVLDTFINARAFIHDFYKVSDTFAAQTDINDSIIVSNWDTLYLVAHEVMHIVQDVTQHDSSDFSLFTGVTDVLEPEKGKPTDTKRISPQLEKKVLADRDGYLRDPE